ncbi:MAG: APC family permease [Candidatus Nanopelagicales bacterium]
MSILAFARHRRSIESLNAESGRGEGGTLQRSLGFWALTFLSIGAMVGTGIFFVLGTTVSRAGPGVLLSFGVAGLLSILSALSYAELVASMPVSGSAYSFAYATLGHFLAWLTGIFLTLEYGLSVSAVAVGWGAYVNDFLGSFGIRIPDALAAPPGDGGFFNVPALFVVFAAAALLLRGMSESAKVNSVMVVLKFLILAVFVAIALTAFTPGHFAPFLPHGMNGVWAAAGSAFFAFIGFDAASTAAEEARDPQRDVPRAIVVAVLSVLALYLVVAAAAIGAKPPAEFFDGDPVLAVIAREVTGSDGAARFISAGAALSIFTVVLAVLYGQTRITLAMARDGFLPRLFDRIGARHVPDRNILLTATVFGLLAALVPIGPLLDVTVAGALLAFIVVHIAVLVRRRTRPDLQPSFQAPLGPGVPVAGLAVSAYLLYALGSQTLIITAAILAVGTVIYALRFRGATATEGEPGVVLRS